MVLTYLTHHRLLFFCSIVSGRRNWTPDESPKDCKRCWRNTARWSENIPAATKRRRIRKSRESSRSIYLVPPIETPPPPQAFFSSSLISHSLLLFFEAIGNNWLANLFSLHRALLYRDWFIERNAISESSGLFENTVSLMWIVKLSLLFFSRFSRERDRYPRLPHYLTVLPFFIRAFCYRDSRYVDTYFLFLLMKDIGRLSMASRLECTSLARSLRCKKVIIDILLLRLEGKKNGRCISKSIFSIVWRASLRDLLVDCLPIRLNFIDTWYSRTTDKSFCTN